MRETLDEISPDELDPLFGAICERLGLNGSLNAFTVSDGHLLTVMDGV
ncbi:MAG: hypothetical protein ACOYOO_10110 [Saprospiraceae bacterium]